MRWWCWSRKRAARRRRDSRVTDASSMLAHSLLGELWNGLDSAQRNTGYFRERVAFLARVSLLVP